MQKKKPIFRVGLLLPLFGSFLLIVCEPARGSEPFVDFDILRRRTIAISVEFNDGISLKPVEHGLGTGFFIHPNGYVLTAKHILPDEAIKDPSLLTECQILGQIGDRASNSLSLTVVSIHPDHDAMLLQTVRDEPFSYFALSMEGLSQVVSLNAIGFPSGTDGKIRAVLAPLRAALSEGSKRGEVNARLEGGFSGGPVLLPSAKVVGIIEQSSALAERDTYEFVPALSLSDWLRPYTPMVSLPKPEDRRPRLVDRSCKFEPLSLRYDFVVETPPTDAALLSQIRVSTANTTGAFGCLSATGLGLRSTAEYVVPFYVSDPETVVPADQPLAVEAGKYARFGVTLRPDTLGACGDWSTDVTVSLIFNDGTMLSAPAERLTKNMLAKLPAYSLTENDVNNVLQALRHRRPATRAAAVTAFVVMDFTRESQRRVLGAKLKDPAWVVRSQALSAIRQLMLTELAPDIANLLKLRLTEVSSERDVADAEIGQIVHTLCRLDAFEGRDLVIEMCLNPDFPYREAESAIGILGSSDKQGTVELLIDALSKRHDWLTGQAATMYVQTHKCADEQGGNSKPARYSDALKAIVHGRSSQCKKFIDLLLSRTEVEFDLHKAELLRHVSYLTPGDTLAQDPFILSLEAQAKSLLNHKELLVRAPALRLYSQVSSDDMCVKAIRAGLTDESEAVQIVAVEAAADRSLSSLKPDLEKMLSELPMAKKSGQLGMALHNSLNSLDSN
ncbi:Trypsin-like peptidase domain-containing protein [Planctomicrobium piriforme]|uniref:Trypsin-like peptidase domain-containing protein n=2 Tax=Planctomicrobium piriforme TaxID=1576369 RepID=A0A1I3TK01_9PLAN|nr:Trypsin-like peptidase domain-containing protein [Planctomicrobium piriforme]